MGQPCVGLTFGEKYVRAPILQGCLSRKLAILNTSENKPESGIDHKNKCSSTFFIK
jgi:hypothetical protein